MGQRVVIAPVMDIVPREPGPPVVGGTLVFSSANGVAAAAGQGLSRALPVVTVGEATARAARAAGWQARCAGPTADALVAALVADPPAGPLLHLHGAHARGDVATRLRRAGIDARDRVIYDQPERPLTAEARAALAGAEPVILPIFSPRSAALLSRDVKALAPLHVIALSPAVAEEVHVPDISSLQTCDSPTRDGMDAALKAALRRLCRVERPEGRH